MEGCTFQPAVHSTKQVEVPIWKRDYEYKKSIQEREKKLDEKIKKECSFKPKTTKTPDIKRDKSVDFWKKLSTPIDYKEREEKKQKLEVDGCTFKPKTHAKKYYKNIHHKISEKPISTPIKATHDEEIPPPPVEDNPAPSLKDSMDEDDLDIDGNIDLPIQQENTDNTENNNDNTENNNNNILNDDDDDSLSSAGL